MLNIYRGRESVDKESFIYGMIKACGGETKVIVPDQYTLAAERQALSRLGAKVLLDIEITSFSRLGSSVLAETGGNDKVFIDKYGRHILLSSILSKKEADLNVFSGAAKKETFVETINDFISKAKQYGMTPEDFEEIAEAGDGSFGEVLKRKFADLALIMREYNEAIKDKYTDSEDLMDLYISKIPQASGIEGSVIWIYGFDSFTPKNLSIIAALISAAKEVNVFLTGDRDCRDEELFMLTDMVAGALQQGAAAAGHQAVIRDVRPGDALACGCRRAPAVKAIEKELYAVGKSSYENTAGLEVVKCANIYNEAESAASYVLDLLRKENLRLRDIAVFMNDRGTGSAIVKRVFGEYGIEIFDDTKRSIESSPIAVFVVSLIQTAVQGLRTGDIFKLLKTGLTSLTHDEIDDLENYAIKYRIKGSMWKKPFTKGVFEYGEDGIASINSIRERVMGLLLPVEELCRSVETNAEFTSKLYEYLAIDADFAGRINILTEKQREHGFLDTAEESDQIWKLLMGAFDQLYELVGDEKFDGKRFVTLLSSGLSQMEVGVLPPTADDIVFGTMQRTRIGDTKAVLILGANEGLLPLGTSEDILFSPEELEHIADMGKALGSMERVRNMEENIAIYRLMSKPESHLYISYSVSDSEGGALHRSEIVDRIFDIFPDLEEKEDVLNRGNIADYLGGEINTLRHYVEAMRNSGDASEAVDPKWKLVREYLEASESEVMDKINSALVFDNSQAPLPADLTDSLFAPKSASRSGDEFSFSPSRIEKFSRCPFSHFVSYGLKPEERRVFEISGRELGDLYHEVLMEFSKAVTAEDSWATATEAHCREIVSEILERIAGKYRDGLFKLSNSEIYWKDRALEACTYVCLALVRQRRAGDVTESFFEVPFARGRSLKPIEKTIKGRKIYIEGKIDRLDIIRGGRVKIIDYKTGKEEFDIDEARAGYRLQLMLYLKAGQEKHRDPAGVFYFLIADPSFKADETSKDDLSGKISKEMKKFFFLNGIMVDDADVIKGIAGDLDDSSEVISLSKKKDGTYSRSSGTLITDVEFSTLQDDVDAATDEIISRLLDGHIDLHPKKSKKKVPCTFCPYRSICRFDLSFDGCRYDVVK